LGFKHLSTITGVDAGKDFEILYHLAYKGAVELTLGVSVPKGEPHIPTVADLIPIALFYEREVHEFFGVIFDGHPDLSPLLLPDGWPKDVYPLRKDCTFEELKEIGSKNWG